MAKAHWYHSVVEHESGAQQPVYGCQRSDCTQPAAHSWQRAATDAEVAADAATEGPFGRVVRNPQGPHRQAVFACAEHVPPTEDTVRTHGATCPAPDPGCACDDDEQHHSASGG